jgi:hypothetical protein
MMQAMRLVHIMTGDKYSDKQMDQIFEQAKCAVSGEFIIHPDKTTARNLLEILDAMPNHSYLALVHDPFAFSCFPHGYGIGYPIFVLSHFFPSSCISLNQ